MAAQSSLAQLSSDQIKLYTSRVDADVTFVFSTGQIQAHKLILTNRVPYFQTIFGSGMKESLTNRVNMPETDMESFDVFLRYIYGGQLPSEFDVEQQLNFAKMYDVPGLIADCLPKLKAHLAKFPDLDACIDESARMMTLYEIVSARSIFEQELLRRIESVDLAPARPNTSANFCSSCAINKRSFYVSCSSCGLCFACEQRVMNCSYPTGQCQNEQKVMASFVNQLVKLLLLSHTEKCATLKEKCLQLFSKIDRQGHYKLHFFIAVKKLEKHPDLLGEMVLRYRVGSR